ncbi:MAG: hypothetical protein ABIG92_06540 [Candidatus Omnitrophota bacterium]
MKNLLVDKRDQVIVFLSILSLISVLQGETLFFLWAAAGVFVAASSDIFIRYILYRRFIFPKSAIITGLIVSGIVDYNENWLVLCVFTILAIVSKNIIRYNGRHIFNPANFALFIAMLFKIPLTWNIESNIYLIIAFGLYIAYSLKKLPHIIGFLLFFSLLFGLQRLNPLMLAGWFFIFIMLIEPKTSGFGRIRGFIFGSIAGVSSFLVFKFFSSYDMFVASLFMANLTRPFLERIKE